MAAAVHGAAAAAAPRDEDGIAAAVEVSFEWEATVSALLRICVAIFLLSPRFSLARAARVRRAPSCYVERVGKKTSTCQGNVLCSMQRERGSEGRRKSGKEVFSSLVLSVQV